MIHAEKPWHGAEERDDDPGLTDSSRIISHPMNNNVVGIELEQTASGLEPH